MCAKPKTIFVCQNCGYESLRWQGRCPECMEWNSFLEQTKTPQSKQKQTFNQNQAAEVLELNQIQEDSAATFSSGLHEVNRVLGEGLVVGSVILLGGAPGIGKSTLVLKICANLANQNKTILYASAEESLKQIKQRANRMEVNQTIHLVSDTQIRNIIEQAEKLKCDLLVVDSIQTVFSETLDSSPGTLSQIRQCTLELVQLAKQKSITVLLIGQINKEGLLAGPKVLEHMVDTVLQFEMDPSGHFRLIRTLKNRYGPVNEIGLFEMTAKGLIEVGHPAQLFLDHHNQSLSGVAPTVVIEGSRPFLIEIQALVTRSDFANGKRTSLGMDSARTTMLSAVIEKYLGLKLSRQDIYLNTAGGFRVQEPAADLALAAAMIGSYQNKTFNPKTIFLGEVSLTGAIKPVHNLETRLKEAQKLGYQNVILASKNQVTDPTKLELFKISHLSELPEFLDG